MCRRRTSWAGGGGNAGRSDTRQRRRIASFPGDNGQPTFNINKSIQFLPCLAQFGKHCGAGKMRSGLEKACFAV